MSLPEMKSSLTTLYATQFVNFLVQAESDPKYNTPESQASWCRLRMATTNHEGHLALDVYLKALKNGISPTTKAGMLGRAIAVELYGQVYSHFFDKTGHVSLVKHRRLTKELVAKYLPEISSAIGSVPIKMRKGGVPVSGNEATILFRAASVHLAALNLTQRHIDKFGSVVKYRKDGRSKLNSRATKAPNPPVSAASLKGNVVDIMAAGVPVVDMRTEEVVPKTLTDKYRNWCLNHDYIPTDKVLCYFMDVEKKTVFSSIRHELKKYGFEFEKCNELDYWKVIARPKPAVSETDVKQLQEAMKALEDSQKAATAAMEAIAEMKTRLGLK